MTETLSILTEAALRPAVLGLGAGALLWLCRRRSASTTHGVWVAVVLGMLALPLLTLAPRLPFALPAMAELAPTMSLPSGDPAAEPLVQKGGNAVDRCCGEGHGRSRVVFSEDSTIRDPPLQSIGAASRTPATSFDVYLQNSSGGAVALRHACAWVERLAESGDWR